MEFLNLPFRFDQMFAAFARFTSPVQVKLNEDERVIQTAAGYVRHFFRGIVGR